MKLTGEERVRFLLGAIPYYQERQYSGNYYDNDDLNDILDALARAELTAIQRKVIELTFVEDMSHKAASEVLGIARPTVSIHVRKAVAAIVLAYEKGNSDEFK